MIKWGENITLPINFKIHHHEIADILLKGALNTNNQIIKSKANIEKS